MQIRHLPFAVPTAASLLLASAVLAQEPSRLAQAPTPIVQTNRASGASAVVTEAFYRRPGAAICPSHNRMACQDCLPPIRSRPCGIGAADCGVALPYQRFLFYGTKPQDNDPINRTWTSHVADQGNLGARHTVDHARIFGY